MGETKKKPHIVISEETKKKLDESILNKKESYEDIILRLINKSKEEKNE